MLGFLKVPSSHHYPRSSAFVWMRTRASYWFSCLQPWPGQSRLSKGFSPNPNPSVSPMFKCMQWLSGVYGLKPPQHGPLSSQPHSQDFLFMLHFLLTWTCPEFPDTYQAVSSHFIFGHISPFSPHAPSFTSMSPIPKANSYSYSKVQLRFSQQKIFPNLSLLPPTPTGLNPVLWVHCRNLQCHHAHLSQSSPPSM